MELTFNKGNYDQHMNMVNTSKELLNDSIVLRSIKDNVDRKIEESQSSLNTKDIGLFLILAIPLFLVVLYATYVFGFSWRIIAGLGMIGFFVVYYTITNDNDLELDMPSPGLHNDDPRPLKFLEMKVDYLSGQNDLKKTRLALLRMFYIIFFPFLCYFLFELVLGHTPFKNILLGLVVSILMSAMAWFLFFKGDFESIEYDGNQLREYKKLIHQHFVSLQDEQE